MPTLILRPVLDKSLTHNCSSGSSGSSLINESIADDDSSYIFQKVNSSTSNAVSESIFSLGDNIGANIKGKFKITSITIALRTKTTKSNDSDSANIGAVLEFGEKHVQPSIQSTGMNYSNRYMTYAGTSEIPSFKNHIFESLNDLNITGIMVQTSGKKATSKNDDFEIRVTQLYLEIEYEDLETPSSGLFLKSNDSWVEAKSVYKKINGAWVEQDDLTSLFSGESSGSASNYVYGGSV